MAIVQMDDFQKEFDEKFKELKAAVKTKLTVEGENAVAYARRNGDYEDRTGNLRAGVGYAVTDDGIDSIGANSKTEQFIKSQDTSGISLVLADGEEYGSYVEAMGRDVLSMAKVQAEENVRRALNDHK
ncbi:hypothetical protein [uncultured Bacteroides sp.]|uniref:hypothetical protein n=1 Tax=uncultured Bacteroides sp. TaxID=162156 RepID=UPI002AAA8BFF|nr:hypothetical protein [uncultured Bacteroides sp.]